jgi:hypothetical protein
MYYAMILSGSGLLSLFFIFTHVYFSLFLSACALESAWRAPAGTGAVLQLPLDKTTQLADALVEHELGMCCQCVCSTNDDELTVVICDSCSSEYHFKCLDPPIDSIDELGDGDWYCTHCDPKPSNKKTRTSVLPVQPIARPQQHQHQQRQQPTPQCRADSVADVESSAITAEQVSKALAASLSRTAAQYGSLVAESAAATAAAAAGVETLKRKMLPSQSTVASIESARDAAAVRTAAASALPFPSPFWWQLAPRSFLLPNAHMPPPPEWMRLHELPAPAAFASVAQLLDMLGAVQYAAVFEQARIRVCDLWALSEQDFERLMPMLGPRRRLQAYIRARAKELAEMCQFLPPLQLTLHAPTVE